MRQRELKDRIDELKDKLSRAQRQASGLRQKSKVLEMQYQDARQREANSSQLMKELLERQRELNVMLNRANIMIHRTQEAIALTSVEFNEIAKALPEPKKAEFSERVAKINELFRKTGIQDAEIEAPGDGGSNSASQSLDSADIEKESQASFGVNDRSESIWERTQRREPPQVAAEVVQEQETAEPQQAMTSDDVDASASTDQPTPTAQEEPAEPETQPEEEARENQKGKATLWNALWRKVGR